MSDCLSFIRLSRSLMLFVVSDLRWFPNPTYDDVLLLEQHRSEYRDGSGQKQLDEYLSSMALQC